MGGLRGPREGAGGDIPGDISEAGLGAPKAIGVGEGGLVFSLPAVGVGPLGDSAAIGEVGDPSRVDMVDGPVEAEDFGEAVVGAAGVEATDEGGAGVEAVFFVVEGTGTATGVDMGFEDSDAVAGVGEEGGGGEAAEAGADDNGVGLGFRGHAILGWAWRVYQRVTSWR